MKSKIYVDDNLFRGIFLKQKIGKSFKIPGIKCRLFLCFKNIFEKI